MWFSFSLFAIVVVLILAVVQNALLDSRYREHQVERLKTAGEEVQKLSLGADKEETGKILFDVCRRSGVRGYLLYEDGNSVFPEITDRKSYFELTKTLKKEFGEDKESVTFSDENELFYAVETELEGRSCYLCMNSSLQPLGEFENALGLISLVTVLVAIVLAFVASAFVAVFVTKPVMAVTERAKALARGDFSKDFKENYFYREINELSDALDYACTEISKTDRMQKELIANVSHDFKTPLTMIKAYASMIREISGDDKEKRDNHAKIIIDETDRLAALVGDVLDLSKIRAGVTEDGRTVFNLSEEVYRVVNRFDFLKETAGYVIETEIEDDLYISANRDRIGQVLYNLIGNAVNYTGEDKKVTVKLFKAGENSRFEVKDTGKGIRKEDLETIWDRYYRSGEAHQRPVQGTGLGLSIVKGILEAHGYPFGVESEEGKGSCFWAEFFPPPAEESGEENSDGQATLPKEKEKKERIGGGV